MAPWPMSRPVRRELGARTLFNLLGPLSNPAGVRRALIGVFAEAWMEPIAQTLQSSARKPSGSSMARRTGRNLHDRADEGSGAGARRLAPVRDHA